MMETVRLNAWGEAVTLFALKLLGIVKNGLAAFFVLVLARSQAFFLAARSAFRSRVWCETSDLCDCGFYLGITQLSIKVQFKGL